MTNKLKVSHIFPIFNESSSKTNSFPVLRNKLKGALKENSAPNHCMNREIVDMNYERDAKKECLSSYKKVIDEHKFEIFNNNHSNPMDHTPAQSEDHEAKIVLLKYFFFQLRISQKLEEHVKNHFLGSKPSKTKSINCSIVNQISSLQAKIKAIEVLHANQKTELENQLRLLIHNFLG